MNVTITVTLSRSVRAEIKCNLPAPLDNVESLDFDSLQAASTPEDSSLLAQNPRGVPGSPLCSFRMSLRIFTHTDAATDLLNWIAFYGCELHVNRFCWEHHSSSTGHPKLYIVRKTLRLNG